MGFSYRVGKGVRVRVSSRGVRTSIGPRAARVHVGGGRTGFSTGAGPVGYYTSVGGSRARSSGGGTRSAGASQRQLAQAQKAEEGQALAAAIQQLFDLHRVEFPSASPPVAPYAPPIDAAAIAKRHEVEQLEGVGRFKRSERSEARQRAAAAAELEIASETQRLEAERIAWQASLDEQWRLLLANDPTIVLACLEDAFEDNEAKAAPLYVEGDELGLVVLTEGTDALPERMPALTAAGNLTLKKITKADRAALYRTMVCGHVLVTIKEALAVAPAINVVRVVALRSPGVDSYGRTKVDVLIAARFDRGALEGIEWSRADATEIVADAASELLLTVKGQAKELQPLDISAEPALLELVGQVELDELVG